MGNKYLSEVLSAKDIVDCKNNKICILSGVGSGKNYFVETELANEGNILYISSRRAKVNEILEEKLANERITWANEWGDIVTTTNYGIEKLVKNEKFGKGFSEIIEHFQFIVVDEAHSIAADATFASSAFHLMSFLDYVDEKYPSVKIILMTGTPEPLEYVQNFFKEYAIFDKREECINVLPKQIRFIEKKTAIAYMAQLPENQKTIYYTNSAKGIVKGKYALIKQLQDKGISEKEACICMGEDSIKKLKRDFEDLEKVCKETKEAITKTRALPTGKRFLFTTSTLKEGINIEDTDIKVAFCETLLLSDIIQFAGRVRKGLDTLYIIEGANQHDVEENTFRKYGLEAVYNNMEAEKASNSFLKKVIKNEDSAIYSRVGFDSGYVAMEPFMNEDYSLSIYGGEAIKPFIEQIESKHQYLRFNHLKGRFDFFMIRYREQLRVHMAIEKQGWVKDLADYCQKHNINYKAPTIKSRVNLEEFCEYLKLKSTQLLIDEEKEELILLFKSVFNLKSDKPQIGTMKKCLVEKELPFELEDGMTSRGGKNKRYLCIKEIQ